MMETSLPHTFMEKTTDIIARMFGFPGCPPAIEPQLYQLLAAMALEIRKEKRICHPILQALIENAKKYDYSSMSLREIAEAIGMKGCHAQRIKHHLGKFSLLSPNSNG